MGGDGKLEYEVRLRSRRVRRELDSLREADYLRVLARLRELGSNPRPAGCQKLAGINDIYRLRVGDIRIVYLIDEANRRVDVGAVRRRSERTYRRTDDLFQ